MKYHVYRCKRCDEPLVMIMDHVTPGWTAEQGCAENCVGTFLHPDTKCDVTTRRHPFNPDLPEVVVHEHAKLTLVDERPGTN